MSPPTSRSYRALLVCALLLPCATRAVAGPASGPGAEASSSAMLGLVTTTSSASHTNVTETPTSEAESGSDTQATPTPTSGEELTNLEGKVDGMNETLSAVSVVVDQLKLIKLSGYIQGRYEYHADSEDGLTSAGKPATTTQFLVRRGRLKTVYAGRMAEFVLQIDATPKGVTLKDAEATLIEPWTNLGLRLTAGQFKWPFGYEVIQSSGVREMPERSRVIRALFPGERDRGVRIQGSWSVLRFAAALVNGNGTEDPIYGATDQNKYKDVVGRVGVDFDWLVVGLSGYFGEGIATTLGDAKASPPTETTYASFRRARYGADVQAYIDIPSVGGLALKGEVIGARDKGNVDAYGFYVLGVQHLGEGPAVFLRVDHYDPNSKSSGDSTSTIGGGAQYTVSENLRASITYEHPMSGSTDKPDPSDDSLTLQLQGMF